MQTLSDLNDADAMISIDTERILADAETAAIYFRALSDKGVPLAAAAQLTASYVSSAQFARASAEKPKEPWEKDGA